MTASPLRSPRVAFFVLGLCSIAAFAGLTPQTASDPAAQPSPDPEQIARGRMLVVSHGCGDCHGGFANPASPEWLSGMRRPEQEFMVAGFRTRPRNITPDNRTGIGRFTERQLFNAIRFGLRPGETPDVEITSTTPGEGNFPLNPKYLAPPMPWFSFRHMPDQEVWDIVAYLKYGVKPVEHLVEDSEGPPDFWAGLYTPEFIGPYPLPPFPSEGELAIGD